MRITRLSDWKREGLLGILAIHIAVFFVFVLTVSFLTLSIEEGFVNWISDAGGVQIITVLLAALALYIAIEAGLFAILLSKYVEGVLEEPWAQREWIAYTMLASMVIATLTSPWIFGSFSLILPGLPELIVWIGFPYIWRKRYMKTDEPQP